MYRARIGLAAAAVVAILTAVVAMSVGSTVTTASTKSVESAVERAQAAFPKLDLLRGIEQTNETAKMAREDEFGEVFTKSGDAQRQAAFVAVQARNARLEQAGHKADLVAVVGANGHVVSRDLNIDAMYDDDLKAKFPSVGTALNGVANKDVWKFDGHLYRVAAAPIRSKSGAVVGVLVVGYGASAQDASSDRDKTGAEVAYFLDDKLQASSFKKEGGESTEEKQLAAQLFDGPKYAATAATENTKQFHLKIGGEDWVGAAGPLPGNMTKSRGGFVVLASLSQARAPYAGLQGWVLLLGIVSLLAAVAATVLTAVRFINPLDHIETGVAEVINGNHDYSFESPSQDFEGLANALNVMMARLTGRPDPTDEDTGGEPAGGQQRWQGELAVDDNVSRTGPQESPENAALAAEPEADYLRRVFNEYVAARQKNNEGTEGLELGSFSTKLRQNEAQLKAKHNCRAVRFKVVVKNGQTTLKPVPIA
jgi:hypothetical protein